MTLHKFDTDESVRTFLNSAPRYKLVIAQNSEKIKSLPMVNISRELARCLKNLEISDLKFQSRDFLNDLIIKETRSEDCYGKYVCLDNIGILFEPELGFDVTEILARWSTNTLVILNMPGTVKYPFLHFLTPNSKHKINLSKLNYIII